MFISFQSRAASASPPPPPLPTLPKPQFSISSSRGRNGERPEDWPDNNTSAADSTLVRGELEVVLVEKNNKAAASSSWGVRRAPLNGNR